MDKHEEFLLTLFSFQTTPLTLNEVARMLPKVPRESVRVTLEILTGKGLLKATPAAHGFPRDFELA